MEELDDTIEEEHDETDEMYSYSIQLGEEK